MRIKKTLLPIILILALFAGCASASQPVPTDREPKLQFDRSGSLIESLPSTTPDDTSPSTPIYRDTLVNIEKDNTEPPSNLFNMETGEIYSTAFTPAPIDLEKSTFSIMERWYAFPGDVKYGDANTPTVISFWVDYNEYIAYDIPSASETIYAIQSEVWLRKAEFDSLFNLNFLPEMISNGDFEESSKLRTGIVKLFLANDGVLEEVQGRYGTKRAVYLPNSTDEWFEHLPHYAYYTVQRIITGVNYTVTTPAGTFENCIEIYTKFPDYNHAAVPSTKTYYAPWIGEVLVMEMENDGVNNQEIHAPRSMLMYYEIHD